MKVPARTSCLPTSNAKADIMVTAHSVREASPKQVALITSLAAERIWQDCDAADVIMDIAGGAGKVYSTREASAAIDALFQCKRKPVTTAAASVPAGRYAIERDGVTKFYRVDCPTEGKWAGYTFVKVQASDDEYPVRGASKDDVLAQIAEDPHAASKRYGREIGRCGVCGRTLTDETSRTNGIGPKCAGRF